MWCRVRRTGGKSCHLYKGNFLTHTHTHTVLKLIITYHVLVTSLDFTYITILISTMHLRKHLELCCLMHSNIGE